ncbi:hypothetical protein OIU84_024989 [Salix udensis]|uniref:Uncharacterized protein n=1 Tax=Salix udensis TaxID=889485 RepID=A0AAD6PCK1_9ROSI|nr:hypothetical protein OIU84_024989 [Salix udensis]
MSRARIFSKKTMLAGEVATVDDCRYLVSWYRETSLINTYLILGEFFFFFFFFSQEYFQPNLPLFP